MTDLVGNPLFGLFTGGFPTGVGETTPQDFIQNLGLKPWSRRSSRPS